MKRMLLACLIAIFTFFSTQTEAVSPWTPKKHQFVYNFAFTNEFANNFWLGKVLSPLPATIVIDSLWGGFDLGLTNDLALDLLTGYSWASFPGASRGPFDGFQDTLIGLRYRVINEFKTKHSAPTITLRIGAIVKGEYQISSTGNIHAPGDGVNGVQFMILFGKRLPANFAVAGELGFAIRTKPAPDEYLITIGIYRNQDKHFSWNVQYRRSADTFGLDIGGPNFTGSQPNFKALREIKNYVSGGVGYTSNSGLYIGTEVSKVVFDDNRNTNQSTIFALYVSSSLGGKADKDVVIEDLTLRAPARD